MPAGAIKPGEENVLAIRVFDGGGPGGGVGRVCVEQSSGLRGVAQEVAGVVMLGLAGVLGAKPSAGAGGISESGSPGIWAAGERPVAAAAARFGVRWGRVVSEGAEQSKGSNLDY